MSYAQFEFEGAPVPPPSALAEALLDPADRARLVRAGVVVADFADALLAAAAALLVDRRPEARGVAIQLGLALYARGLVPAVGAALAERPGDFVGIPDPTDAGVPARTLAQSALAFVVRAATPGSAAARAALERALAEPELRVQAWDALGAVAPEAVIPSLGALLTQAPELAERVATRFALVHTPLCEAACRAIVDLPEPTRRAFAESLEKHLKRIFSIRQWVACRQILFGR